MATSSEAESNTEGDEEYDITAQNPKELKKKQVQFDESADQSGGDGTNKDRKLSAASLKRQEKLRKKRKKRLKKIAKEHPEFELSYDMMLGIRYAVSLSEPSVTLPSQTVSQGDDSSSEEDQELESEFVEAQKMKFPKKGTDATPAHGMRDFKFKDYCPQIFRQLREWFGISTQHYLVTICGDFNLLEFISNSKSGQFFFFSHNSQFIIKTMTRTESIFLRKVMPQYFQYVQQQPYTLLPKFFGMHRVKVPGHPVTYFLIMTNVFYSNLPIHVQYDLKGSTHGRRATSEERASGAILKDLDFMDDNRKIRVGSERAKLFKEQLRRDTEWLRKQKMMDYSLLVGIHFRDQHKKDQQEQLKKQQHEQMQRRHQQNILQQQEGTQSTDNNNPNATMASAANTTTDQTNSNPNQLQQSQTPLTPLKHERRQSHNEFGLENIPESPRNSQSSSKRRVSGGITNITSNTKSKDLSNYGVSQNDETPVVDGIGHIAEDGTIISYNETSPDNINWKVTKENVDKLNDANNANKQNTKPGPFLQQSTSDVNTTLQTFASATSSDGDGDGDEGEFVQVNELRSQTTTPKSTTPAIGPSSIPQPGGGTGTTPANIKLELISDAAYDTDSAITNNKSSKNSNNTQKAQGLSQTPLMDPTTQPTGQMFTYNADTPQFVPIPDDAAIAPGTYQSSSARSTPRNFNLKLDMNELQTPSGTTINSQGLSMKGLLNNNGGNATVTTSGSSKGPNGTNLGHFHSATPMMTGYNENKHSFHNGLSMVHAQNQASLDLDESQLAMTPIIGSTQMSTNPESQELNQVGVGNNARRRHSFTDYEIDTLMKKQSSTNSKPRRSDGAINTLGGNVDGVRSLDIINNSGNGNNNTTNQLPNDDNNVSLTSGNNLNNPDRGFESDTGYDPQRQARFRFKARHSTQQMPTISSATSIGVSTIKKNNQYGTNLDDSNIGQYSQFNRSRDKSATISGKSPSSKNSNFSNSSVFGNSPKGVQQNTVITNGIEHVSSATNLSALPPTRTRGSSHDSSRNKQRQPVNERQLLKSREIERRKKLDLQTQTTTSTTTTTQNNKSRFQPKFRRSKSKRTVQNNKKDSPSNINGYLSDPEAQDESLYDTGDDTDKSANGKASGNNKGSNGDMTVLSLKDQPSIKTKVKNPKLYKMKTAANLLLDETDVVFGFGKKNSIAITGAAPDELIKQIAKKDKNEKQDKEQHRESIASDGSKSSKKDKKEFDKNDLGSESVQSVKSGQDKDKVKSGTQSEQNDEIDEKKKDANAINDNNVDDRNMSLRSGPSDRAADARQMEEYFGDRGRSGSGDDDEVKNQDTLHDMERKSDDDDDNDNNLQRDNPFTSMSGGMAFQDENGEWGNEIYFVGIIDILQKYNKRKKLENFVKGLKSDRSTISAVRPEYYANRMCDFFEDKIL